MHLKLIILIECFTRRWYQEFINWLLSALGPLRRSIYDHLLFFTVDLHLHAIIKFNLTETKEANCPGENMSTLSSNFGEQSVLTKVAALVVTWNRKNFLEKNVNSLLKQTRKVDIIIIIDNGSLDGSLDHLKAAGLLSDDRILYLRLSKNYGPAAGFVRGFKEAVKCGFNYLWVMDDDVIPDHDALQHLVEACEKNFSPPHPVGFLASLVMAPNGTAINVPEVDLRLMPSGYPGWNQLLDQGIVKVRASSFVSILFPWQTIEDFGLPSKDFYM